jgi:Na+/melibiose symporter-like transporter
MESESTRFISVMLSYLFFSIVVSIVMFNYNALHAEITLDYHGRSSLSSIRIFFFPLSSFDL